MSGKRVPVPEGLQKSAALWRKLTAEYELRADELRHLEDACRTLDLIERMESELRTGPLFMKGSQGQDVANPLAGEIRQHRALLVRLFAALHLPEEAEQAERGAQARSAAARSLANQRWQRGA